MRPDIDKMKQILNVEEVDISAEIDKEQAEWDMNNQDKYTIEEVEEEELDSIWLQPGQRRS